MKKNAQTFMKPLLVMAMLFTIACSSDDTTSDGSDDTTSSSEDHDISSDTGYDTTNEEDNDIEYGTTHEDSDDYEWDESEIVDITLNGTSITSTDTDVVDIYGTIATINSSGTYRITGSLNDGSILVDTEDEATLKIIFNGVDISNASTSPFAIMSAEKVVLIVADGTENFLSDSADYVFEEGEDEPDAALFSKSDLTIYGTGNLSVDGYYNEAIKSKDGLILKDVDITVNSVDDGIQGKDYLVIRSGTIEINSTGDGLKSNNDEDAELGYIQIDDGTITIIAEADAVQAETQVIVNGGNLDLTAGGGSKATIGDDNSAKGLKGATGVVVDTGATIYINAAEDGIHSDASVTINGGDIGIAAGDDAIHSDYDLVITGGNITISESYEGIEGADIIISGGNIELTSSDDGINGAGDESGSVYTLDISGGYIYVNASGDGIDVNGSITMTDGVVIVNGPTQQGNGALDYDNTFNISGGFLLAVGSSGMAQAPSNSSTQNSILVKLSSSQSSGTLLHLEDANGQNLFTFAPAKSYSSLVFSSPDLSSGTTYNLYVGGSCNGTPLNGLYTDGTYSVGDLYETFTISSIITSIN